MAVNEKTSVRVASIAGTILEALKGKGPIGHRDVRVYCGPKHGPVFICTVRELKALAASALTQSPDRPGMGWIPEPKGKKRKKS